MKYKQRTMSEQEKARKVRENRITVLFYENNQIYSARKLHHLLQQEGIIASIRTISADMKRLQLRCCYVKKWREKQAKSTEETLMNEIKADQP
ncbi:IS3 family transposase [Listeria cornellensis]|uniref:IS3 family transposase n=1 Tax=Listeria cornellensis TaxID=1494961 RepID=UPI0011EA53A2